MPLGFQSSGPSGGRPWTKSHGTSPTGVILSVPSQTSWDPLAFRTLEGKPGGEGPLHFRGQEDRVCNRSLTGQFPEPLEQTPRRTPTRSTRGRSSGSATTATTSGQEPPTPSFLKNVNKILLFHPLVSLFLFIVGLRHLLTLLFLFYL